MGYDPGGGIQTLYGHCSRLTVSVGDVVATGQKIAEVGSTGWATGPHLHFEFRVNGVHQDPENLAGQAGAAPISTASRPAFNQLASAMRTQLSAAGLVQQASAQ